MQSGRPSPQVGGAPCSISIEKGEARPLTVRASITLDDYSRLSGDVIFLVDPSGVCLDVSANVHELLGYQPQAILGRRLQQFEPRAQKDTPKSVLADLGWLIPPLQGADTLSSGEIALVDSAGRVRRLHMRAIAPRASDLGIAGLLVSVSECGVGPTQSAAGHNRNASPHDGESMDVFRKAFVERIHRLNNLLTAFGCQWDLAIKTCRVELGPLAGIEQLTATFEQLTDELLQLSRSCTAFLSPARPPAPKAPGRRRVDSFAIQREETHDT